MLRQSQQDIAQAFAVIVNDDGTVDVVPGLSFTEDHIPGMIDVLTAAKAAVLEREAATP